MARRRTTPVAPIHCAPRPIGMRHPAAGLAGRPIPPPDRPTQPQTRLPGTRSAPNIDASLGLRCLNFLSVVEGASMAADLKAHTVFPLRVLCLVSG